MLCMVSVQAEHRYGIPCHHVLVHGQPFGRSLPWRRTRIRRGNAKRSKKRKSKEVVKTPQAVSIASSTYGTSLEGSTVAPRSTLYRSWPLKSIHE